MLVVEEEGGGEGEAQAPISQVCDSALLDGQGVPTWEKRDEEKRYIRRKEGEDKEMEKKKSGKETKEKGEGERKGEGESQGKGERETEREGEGTGALSGRVDNEVSRLETEAAFDGACSECRPMRRTVHIRLCYKIKYVKYLVYIKNANREIVTPNSDKWQQLLRVEEAE